MTMDFAPSAPALAGPAVPADSRLAEWRRGGPTVAAAAVGYGTGVVMILLTAGLFVKPMRDSLGWSAKEVAIAPIVTLVWALASPLAGLAVGRFGSRRVALFGGSAMLACIVLIANAPASHLMLYSLAVVLGLISPLTNMVPFASGVAGWFRRDAGLALGITFNGSSLVALIAVPAVSYAIATWGWRAGYWMLAAIIGVLGLPAVLAFFREASVKQTGPSDRRAAPGQLGVILRNGRFWDLFVALGFASIALGGFMGHLQPLLAQRRFSLAEATALGVLYAVSASAGRVAGGAMLDRLRPYAVAASFFVMAATGSCALAWIGEGGPTALTVTTIALLGLGQGAEADFLAFFTLRSLGRAMYPQALGLLVMGSGLGMAAGSFAFAAAFDWAGDYQLACYGGGVCFLIAAAGLLLAGHRAVSQHGLSGLQAGVDNA